MITVEKLKNIQVLRAVAALLVLTAHIQGPVMAMRERIPSCSIPGWLTNLSGASGVDIFFVISGYVICLTAARPGGDAWHFLRHRFARIVPLHYALTVVLLVCFLAMSVPVGPRQILNSFIFLPVFNTTNFTKPVNVMAWTLCFEMWFYLLFALLLLKFPARRPRCFCRPSCSSARSCCGGITCLGSRRA